jgi:hypothetical protein
LIVKVPGKNRPKYNSFPAFLFFVGELRLRPCSQTGLRPVLENPGNLLAKLAFSD